MSPPQLPPRVNLVTLGVKDLATAKRFYETLGWRTSSASQPEIAFLHTRGTGLILWSRELLAEDARVPAAGSGFAGIALATNVPRPEDVAASLAAAVAAGGTLRKPATKADWGGVSGYFADPDGHLWEVAWNPFFPLDAEGQVHLPE